MPRPPNYKQEKKRREDEQRKRNAEAEQRKSVRKAAPVPGTAGDGTKPEVP
ncbi:MAG: hypothetical protein WDO68_16870 [Gammaproteobacteria bacterium]